MVETKEVCGPGSPTNRPAIAMLWIFITVPLAVLVIAMVVTPLVVTILREERDQRRLSLDDAARGDIRRIESRPEVAGGLRRTA